MGGGRACAAPRACAGHLIHAARAARPSSQAPGAPFHTRASPWCPLTPALVPHSGGADKSVFEFYAMSEEQQRARIEQLRLQVAGYGSDEDEL